MADPFELILSGNLSDAEKQKMIAKHLRNRKQLGDVSMLTGDARLGKFGASLGDDVQNTEREALTTQAGEAQRALTGDYYKQMAGQSALAQTMAQRRAEETERHNRAMELKGDAASAKTADTNVRKLSESMTRAGIPELKRDMSSVQSTLDDFSKRGADVPGVGATGWVPQMLLSPKGADMRQKLATVRNKFLKLRSGAAVTDPEMNRMIDELGSMDDRDLILAWPKLIAGINEIEKGIKAGYDDDVVGTFEERMGRGKNQPPDEPNDTEPDADSDDEESEDGVIDFKNWKK